MKFMMTYQIATKDWDKAVDRFLETGAPAPEGVEMIGRWHSAAGRNGFLLLESRDQAAIYRFAAEWHDVCDLAITPLVDDEQAEKVLKSLR